MKKTYLRNTEEYPEFEYNPVMEEIVKSKVVRRKLAYKQYKDVNNKKHVDPETGEEESIMAYITGHYKLADRRNFYKLFPEGIRMIGTLTTSELEAFLFICELLSQDQDYIYFSYHDFKKKTGYSKDYVVTDSLTGLLDKRVIFRTFTRNKFWINPRLIFNGSLVPAVEEYTRSLSFKVFVEYEQEDLDTYSPPEKEIVVAVPDERSDYLEEEFDTEHNFF